jgi:hypothetical protein
MIETILDIAFSGFWKFLGMYFLLVALFYFVVNLIYKSWVSFMRMIMVRKHGWPPDHLDADGDNIKKNNSQP